MPTSAWVINLVVLTVVLEADLGHRRITLPRLARPVVLAAVIVGIYIGGVVTSGDGFNLEIGFAVLGIVLGLVASALIRVRVGQDGAPWSNAGVAYALLWMLVIGARLGFTYASTNMHQLEHWLATHAISGDALKSALIFMAVTMLLTRTIGLLLRARLVRGRETAQITGLDRVVSPATR